MADFCVDNTQQVEFDEKVVCGLWQCEALRASQKARIHYEKNRPWIQEVNRNSLKLFQIVHSLMCDLSWKFHENPFIRFLMMSLRDTDLFENTEKETLYPKG